MTTRINGVLQSESIYEAVRRGQNAIAPDVLPPTPPAETLLAAIAATDTHSLHPLLMYSTRQRNVLTKTGQVRSLTILVFPVNLTASQCGKHPQVRSKDLQKD